MESWLSSYKIQDLDFSRVLYDFHVVQIASFQTSFKQPEIEGGMGKLAFKNINNSSEAANFTYCTYWTRQRTRFNLAKKSVFKRS